jgi:hypothetical protein
VGKDDDEKGRGHQGPGWWPEQGGTPSDSGRHRPYSGGRRQSGRGSILDNCLGRIVVATAVAVAVVWASR